MASENLVTWRTAFYDLDCGGVMPLVGMEAGCTPSPLVSGGVLSNPNYGTRIKRARMTTLAMTHQPEGELWLRYDLTLPSSPARIRRVGYNFGAPGDRFADDGTLWLNVVPRETAGVIVEPEDVGWFSSYSSRGKSWIASSGVVGAREIVIPTHLFKGKKPPEVEPARYTVRLHFALPAIARPGQRVFHVAIEGRQVLSSLDLARAADRPPSGLIHELKGIEAGATLRISLDQLAKLPAVLCGVQIVREP